VVENHLIIEDGDDVRTRQSRSVRYMPVRSERPWTSAVHVPVAHEPSGK